MFACLFCLNDPAKGIENKSAKMLFYKAVFFSNVHFDKTQAAGKRKGGPNKILEKAYTTRMKSYLPTVDLLIEIKIKRNGLRW